LWSPLSTIRAGPADARKGNAKADILAWQGYEQAKNAHEWAKNARQLRAKYADVDAKGATSK
jgi:hypothetical protein